MSTTDTTEPASRAEFPFAVTITRPGHPTLYLGYRFQHSAEHAAWAFTDMLTGTAHPTGTTINWGATPPDVEIVPPAPTTPREIAEHPDFPGERPPIFPDLYARVLAQHGHDLAPKLWSNACSIYDAMHQPEEEAEVEVGSFPIDPHTLESVLLEHVGESETRAIFAALGAAAGGAR
ncbi:Hypothetical protein AJAP_42595 (plasmid) [Amycolatopsis japonica]|uniref:Uncharacterized protein n=1 Tax=Amycolatopsis japonica TaxID=208439 RepID=A0A075VAC5_9PSEU|nr:hypothetical protein [Amycolatopsis japonica]AIG81286.1 Hypothetical protein AJAP_42595 [Amycolatopsis japonica]